MRILEAGCLCIMQNSYNKAGEPAVCAGFFVRMAAHLIDMLIVGGILLFARIPLALLSLFLPTELLEYRVLFSYTIKDIYLYLGGVLYYILLTYYTGTTLGKKLMNLRIVSETGEKLTLFNVIYRETIGRFLCSFFWGIGYIMAGIDGQKRGLHDMICGTRVIYEKRVKVTVVNSGVPQGSYGMPHCPMQNPAVRAGSEQRQSVEKVDREVCRQMQGDRMDEKIEERQEIKETEDEKRRL